MIGDYGRSKHARRAWRNGDLHMLRRQSSARAIDRRSFDRRLSELESHAAINDKPSQPIAVVFVEPNGHFGGRECHSDRASELGGYLVWHRKPDEAQENFKQRVMGDVPERKGPNVTVIIFWPTKKTHAASGV